MNIKKMIEELLLESDAEMVYYSTDEAIKRHKERCYYLVELLEKQEQGLLISLPCKTGDTVYTACSWGIESGVVGNIEIIFDRIFVNNKNGAMIGEAHNIFLTRYEAEEALARMNKEDN